MIAAVGAASIGGCFSAPNQEPGTVCRTGGGRSFDDPRILIGDVAMDGQEELSVTIEFEAGAFDLLEAEIGDDSVEKRPDPDDTQLTFDFHVEAYIEGADIRFVARAGGEQIDWAEVTYSCEYTDNSDR